MLHLLISSQLSTNVKLMEELGVVSKLLFVLKDETTPISTVKVTCEVLTVLLNHGTDKRNAQNILRSVDSHINRKALSVLNCSS